MEIPQASVVLPERETSARHLLISEFINPSAHTTRDCNLRCPRLWIYNPAEVSLRAAPFQEDQWQLLPLPGSCCQQWLCEPHQVTDPVENEPPAPAAGLFCLFPFARSAFSPHTPLLQLSNPQQVLLAFTLVLGKLEKYKSRNHFHWKSPPRSPGPTITQHCQGHH